MDCRARGLARNDGGMVPFWIAKFVRNEAEKYFKAKKLRSAELLLYA